MVQDFSAEAKQGADYLAALLEKAQGNLTGLPNRRAARELTSVCQVLMSIGKDFEQYSDSPRLEALLDEIVVLVVSAHNEHVASSSFEERS